MLESLDKDMKHLKTLCSMEIDKAVKKKIREMLVKIFLLLFVKQINPKTMIFKCSML